MYIIEQKVKGKWVRAPFRNWNGKLVEGLTPECAFVDLLGHLDDLRDEGKRPRESDYRIVRKTGE